MKKSGYRTALHVYLIFFFSLLGTVAAAFCFFCLLTTVRKPDGSTVRSDWPRVYTERFKEQILFPDGRPQLRQTGLDELHREGIGLQVLDPLGQELLSYQKPGLAADAYSGAALLLLGQTGRLEGSETITLAGTVSHDGVEYLYLLHFPLRISRITMFLNGERFAGGKTVLLALFGILFSAVLLAGVLYGFWSAASLKRLTGSIREIADRRYLPLASRGVFRDLYDSLNALDAEIQASDRLREETETMRREWLANITHDLKTPLSPIKGYAELLCEDGSQPSDRRHQAAVILKNASFMETLIDDLKLTYQLESGMLPIDRQEQDLVRFLRELAIDVLNTPEYESRSIFFECKPETLLFSFDKTLMARAFRNLLINAFVHGGEDTEITLQLMTDGTDAEITVADNGPGMTRLETERLFQRYYRGTDTRRKTEGSGLGLAIVKSIVELHGGAISVSSLPDAGTSFIIQFPLS